MNNIVKTIHASSLQEILEREGVTSSGSIFQNSGEGSIGDIVSSIVDIAIPLAGAAALILLIVAGYKMISSQGNPDKLNDAKEMATNAIIGLVFILLSVAILVLVSNVFELDIQTQ